MKVVKQKKLQKMMYANYKNNSAENKSSVEDTSNKSLSESDINSIDFIFCRVYKPHLYYYGINSLKELSVCDKDELKLLLIKLGADFNKIESLLNRNLPFLFIKENSQIKEFEITSELSKDEVTNRVFSELEKKSIKVESHTSVISTKMDNLYKSFRNSTLKF